MAQFDCTDESTLCLSSSIIDNLLQLSSVLFFPEINSVQQEEQQEQEQEQQQQQEQQEQESMDSPNQLEECSAPTGISSALRSVGLMHTLDFKRAHVHKLFAVQRLEEDTPTVSPVDDQDESTEGAAEEEALTVSFQSKFIDYFPLYQDYCLQAVKNDLHRLSQTFVSELINHQYLQGLHSRLISPRGDSEPTSPQSIPPEETPSSHLPRPVRVTPCTLWQDLPEVKASGLLSILTTREIRLQETMFELIGSEASYLRSLGVAVSHFYASKALKQTLNQTEHHILFSNIRCVMAASEKFLMDLEMRLGESVFISQVGDVVLQHCPEFHRLYVPYVTNMMYQEALVKQLLQQNRNFVYSLKKLECDPVCQRQSLKSFLVLPFQRITRIKLILESILKLTEPGSDSISNLKKAIEAIHEIVTDCDNGVRKMKQIEELVCLEMLLDFGKVKSVPLVVSGRFLVHQGPVRQLAVATYNSRVSFISVYLHLFNNLLIISSKNRDQSFTVVDHAEFPTCVHIEHLKTEHLGLPPDCFLLHLSKSHTGQPTAMILVAHTSSDKEVWLKVLSSKH